MFEDTYAGDEVKRILKMRVGNVIIYNVIMPVQHSRGPVVVHIVRGCNQKPAVAHQVRQRRSTGAHIQNVSRIDFPEFSEDKAELNRPLVKPCKYLTLEFLSADPLGIAIEKVLDY
jgi:hypothetical protein